MQQAIEQVLATMPETTRVGIITFGSMVYLHDLMAANIATSAVFRGTQESTKNDVAGLIRRGGVMQSPFLAPLGTCSFAVDGVLEGLTPEANAPVRPSLPHLVLLTHPCRWVMFRPLRQATQEMHAWRIAWSEEGGGDLRLLHVTHPRCWVRKSQGHGPRG